jgi:hypothetical protein
MWKKNLNTGGNHFVVKRFSVMSADSKISSPPNHWLNQSPPIFMETVMMEQAVEAVEGTEA